MYPLRGPSSSSHALGAGLSNEHPKDKNKFPCEPCQKLKCRCDGTHGLPCSPCIKQNRSCTYKILPPEIGYNFISYNARPDALRGHHNERSRPGQQSTMNLQPSTPDTAAIVNVVVGPEGLMQESFTASPQPSYGGQHAVAAVAAVAMGATTSVQLFQASPLQYHAPRTQNGTMSSHNISRATSMSHHGTVHRGAYHGNHRRGIPMHTNAPPYGIIVGREAIDGIRSDVYSRERNEAMSAGCQNGLNYAIQHWGRR